MSQGPTKRDYVWETTLRQLADHEKCTIAGIQDECPVTVSDQTVRGVLHFLTDAGLLEHTPNSPVYYAPNPTDPTHQ